MSNYILLAFLLLYSVFKVLLILSYPSQSIQIVRLVGLSGLEPPTSRLSGVRSNRLSYKPIFPAVLSTQPSFFPFGMVEINGIEPLTPCLQSRCSPS